MHLRCYTCWWISNQFEQKWPQYKHERSQFTAKFDLTSGLFDLTSKQFYYVKIQSIPSQANFDLTRGMTLQAWSLQEGSGVLFGIISATKNDELREHSVWDFSFIIHPWTRLPILIIRTSSLCMSRWGRLTCMDSEGEFSVPQKNLGIGCLLEFLPK